MPNTINCTFIQITGSEKKDVYFTVHPYHCVMDPSIMPPGQDYILLRGRIQSYPKGMPLLITYENGYDGLRLISCIEHATENLTVDYLMHEFKMKREPAEKISKINANIFELAGRKNAEALITSAGVSPQKAKDILKKISITKTTRRFIEKYDIPCHAAEEFCRTYDDPERALKSNPYLLLYADVPFGNCDRLAARYGIKRDDEKRIAAAIHEVMGRSENNGNTCITFHDLVTRIKNITKQEGMLDPFEVAVNLTAKDKFACVERTSGDIYCYKRAIYDQEIKTAQHVIRLMRLGGIDFTDEEIKWAENETKTKYATEQKEAFHLLKDTGIAVLTGGPGTGKTTTLNGFLRCYHRKYPTGKVALCAPTAAAAKRMKESTGKNAYTIHKLLDIRPTGYGYLSKNEFNRLEYDLIIVDEASMLDLDLFQILVSSIRDEASLLLLGDRNQLPAVGAGNVLADLLACVPNVQLTRVFRQDEGSIIENSFRILNKAPLLTDEQTKIIVCHTKKEMLDAAKDWMKRLYRKNDPSYVRLLTTSRKKKFEVSTVRLNQIFQSIFNGDKETIYLNGELFSVDDPVVFTRNNYDRGYLNGDFGKVVEIEDEKNLIVDMEGQTIIVSGEATRDIVLAYATTVHKAQGSECEHAIIMLPDVPKALLRNDLLYVAATRAKQQNIFIVEETDEMTHENTLDKATQTVWPIHRDSGLIEEISKLEERNT